MKKISIIVPVYNGAQRILKCIDSIIEQTYGDIEIIILNDGSSDSSDEIIRTNMKRFQDSGRTIKYEYHNNIIEIYNSVEVCSLVINGQIVDKYIGIVGGPFTLINLVTNEFEEFVVEARMGNFFMSLYINGKKVSSVFMAFG